MGALHQVGGSDALGDLDRDLFATERAAEEAEENERQRRPHGSGNSDMAVRGRRLRCIGMSDRAERKERPDLP